MLPIDRYINKKSLELYAQLKGKKLVYLVVNYWLRLRDELAGEEAKQIEFSTLVINLAKKGKCVFPISDITYYETEYAGEHTGILDLIILN